MRAFHKQQNNRMATSEPDARRLHAAFASGHNMLLWAGRDCRSDVLETFSAFSLAWREAKTLRTNDAPEGLYGMALACDSSGRLYSFGGKEGGSNRRINSLFCLDTNSSTCQKITATDTPSHRTRCAMVHFNRQLIVHGGLADDGVSSDLLVFHLDNKTWTTQATTGEKPPPLWGHTLTMTERQRAAMFGGSDGVRPHNDTYTLDMEKWHWSKDEIKGEKPAARCYHTALCIVGPHTAHHPVLMVKGGWDGRGIVFSDMWVLDVTNGVWSQLSLPTEITRRCGHSAVLFGTGPDFRLVIFFGGNASSTEAQFISETTLLLLSWRGGSLVVNMAVRLANLTESQRDQIRRQIFPLSDDKAQEVIDKALEESSIDIRNTVSVLTGLMGSGKTCLLSRIFNQSPPSVYTSTGVAEQSLRGWLHRMGSMSTSCSWQPFSHENVLEFLALNFYQRFVPGDRFHEGNTTPTGAAPLALPAPATAPSSPTSTPSTTSTSATAMLVQTAATTPTAGDYLPTQTAPQAVASMPALVVAQHATPNLSSGHFSSATSTAATLPASKDAVSTPTGSPGLESSSAPTPHLQTAAATMPAQKDAQPTQTADPILKSAPLSVAMSHLQTDTAMPDLKDGAFGFSHGSTCALSSDSYQCLAQPGMVPTGVAPIPLQASSTVALTPTSAATAMPSSDAPSQTLASMPTPGASLSPQAASQRATAMPLQAASPEINSALPRTSMSSQASSQTAAIEKALPPSGMPHLQTAATRSPLTASSEISTALPSGPPNPKAAATTLTANVSMPTQTSATNLNSVPFSVATPHLETAASLTPPIACRPPIASFKLAESSISRSVIKLVKAPKGSENPSRLDLAHFTDTGGQPEYMGSVPSLIHHCDLAMLTVNLKFDVDEYPPVHYHEKGRKYKRALPSQFSNRQIIQKLAMTLQAKRFAQREGQCFRLLVVATHRDCVPWHVRLSSRVRAYHKALTEIFLPACEKELIRCSADEIPFVLNLKEPDSTDLAKLDLIQQKVSDSGVGEVVKTPGAFFIFEQVLREFAEKSGHILSIDECLQIGEELKMGPDMVRSALIFFHRQITFLYYHHVMPNLVFTRPQIPLDCMNSIVQFKYKLESGEMMGVTEELATSVRDGILTEEILSHEHFSKCFVPGLYGPRDAIDLLFHTFTLAPLSCEPQQKTGSSPAVQTKPSTPVKREKREYLMMCLRQAIPDKNVSRYIPASKIAPLVVQFTKNCVPLSCFGRTISCLLAMYDWKLSRADNGSPECLASNIVSLFDSQIPVEILLRDATSHLEVHAHPDRRFTPDRFPEVFVQIRETVFSAIKQVFNRMQLTGIEITPAFVCPCSKSLKHSHVASLHTLAGSSDGFLRCSKTGKNTGTVQKKHKLWLDTRHPLPSSLLPNRPPSPPPTHPPPTHPTPIHPPPPSPLPPSPPPTHQTPTHPPPTHPTPIHPPPTHPTPTHPTPIHPPPTHPTVIHPPPPSALPPSPPPTHQTPPSEPREEIAEPKDESSGIKSSPTEKTVREPVKEASEEPVTEKTKPTLPLLYNWKVHEKVGTEYLIFGTILLNDEDGSLLKTIQDDCHYKCDRINCNILCDWVRGKGRPVTWRVLIETLRTCNLNEIADKIQEKTQ